MFRRGVIRRAGSDASCDKAACRRARVCRGAGRACLKAKFPQLPTAAQEFFMGYLWHRLEQFTFDEMMANLEAASFAPASRDWHEEGLREEEMVDENLAPVVPAKAGTQSLAPGFPLARE